MPERRGGNLLIDFRVLRLFAICILLFHFFQHKQERGHNTRARLPCGRVAESFIAGERKVLGHINTIGIAWSETVARKGRKAPQRVVIPSSDFTRLHPDFIS